jgi:hypothetical protein
MYRTALLFGFQLTRSHRKTHFKQQIGRIQIGGLLILLLNNILDLNIKITFYF